MSLMVSDGMIGRRRSSTGSGCRMSWSITTTVTITTTTHHCIVLILTIWICSIP